MTLAATWEARARASELVLTEDDRSVAHEPNSISRRAGELPAELALRTIRHLASVEKRRACVRRAVLTVGESLAQPMLAARELIARTLIAHMARAGGGRISFVVPPGSGDEQRQALAELAETLGPDAASAGVSIELSFELAQAPPAPDSGVRHR